MSELSVVAAEAAPVAPSRAGMLGFAAFLAVALLLCSKPIIHITAVDFSLAPLFYLLASRRWGFNAGLAAAVVLSLPTIFWWGDGWYVGACVASYLFFQLVRRRGFLAAEAFALFNLVAAPVTIALLSWLHAPHPLIALYVMQYALGEILLAATADALMANVAIVGRFPFIVARKSRSIERIIRTMINFIIAFVLTIAVANQAIAVFLLEQQARAPLRETALDAVRADIRAGRMTGIIRQRTGPDRATLTLFDANAADFADRARSSMGGQCPWPLEVDRLLPYERSYGTWFGACELVHEVMAGRPIAIAIVYSDAQPFDKPWLTYRLLLLLAGAALALAYRMSLSRNMLRTIQASEEFIKNFGTPNLSPPPGLPIKEVDASLREFVARNNSYVAAIEDRDRLTRMAVDLKRSVDLQLMGQISFDARSGVLSFTEVRLTMPPEKRKLQVHAADCPLFAAAADSDVATIEFRTAGGQDFDSLMLTLRQNKGGTAWETGVMVKLSQPRRLRELMVQQARLVDLGGMASAISHEIKQPLFTIAIAAESLQLMLDKGRSGGHSDVADQQMSLRIARIGQQVERAREIIERISQYGRTDAAEPSEIDAGEVMGIVHNFLSAMLDERRIAVSAEIAPGSYKVLMSRIALEQVIVNAVQNAADSIQTRRDAGWTGDGHIVLAVGRVRRKVRCTISDNGVGLSPGMSESAFNAFYTTKADDKGTGLGLFISRQIVIEAGGQIRLRRGDDEGAVVELELPLHEV